MAIPIDISKIKLRRGSSAQRALVTPEEGEPIYIIDTKRLFIGDGSTVGGNVVGNQILPRVSVFPPGNGYTNDVVTYNNAMYQLTGTDTNNAAHWGRIDTKFTSGLTANAANELMVDYSTTQFVISSNQLNLKDGGVTNDKLVSLYAGNQSSSLPFPIFTITEQGLISTISYNLSSYNPATNPEAYFVASASALSSIAVDFSTIVSGLTGFIRIYSTP